VLILALDTTTRGGSVAVTEDDRVLAVVAGDESRTHGERLPAEIAAALDRAAIARRQIDLLAVAAGPGGFTGLRIGLAAMQGLAMTLSKPVAGVSTLAALAEQMRDAGADVIVPWMDAQRGDVFAAMIDRASRAELEAPVAEAPSDVLQRWRPRLLDRRVVFIGDAVTRDRGLIEQAGDGRWQTQVPTALAPEIARLGRRMAERGLAGLPHALTPVYVRRPDAEIEKENRAKAAKSRDGQN
jgi:tRNA threonylcarbamoyladenosine biosynthesis protein TsaB